MATVNKKSYSKFRSTIETTFFGNNIKNVNNLKEAYELAKKSPGTIITDQTVHGAETIGLEKDSKVLLFNDGSITGRYKDARVIIGEPGIDAEKYASILRDAMYQSRYSSHLVASSYIGLEEEFMLKAKLLITEGNENLMYNWLLNFQYVNEEYKTLYNKSEVHDEEDILIYSNPDWYHPEHPCGLAIFDPDNNCAAILGLKYFGEHKKGSLTLAWNIGRKLGYAPCHGGIKEFSLEDDNKYVMSFFGLSGSGKSTLTHHKHNNKYETKILHDDAFVISTEDGSTIALEPSYFDKTQDYPEGCEDNKYLLSVQNCGARLNEEGKVVLVTEDIRNNNGRAIKSILWKENRVNKFDRSIDSIIWITKDPALPPVLKVNNPVLAATFGATLATKRSTAERIKEGASYNDLVIEPYANPFRTYALAEDYVKFKYLFENKGVDCYVINTGSFVDKDVNKEVTIEAIERIVEGRAEFKDFGYLEDMEYLDFEGFNPDFDNQDYDKLLKKSIKIRIDYLKRVMVERQGIDSLPVETINALEKFLVKIKKIA